MGTELIGESRDLLKNSLNDSGSETITDTEEHTGDFYWITVIEKAKIASITLSEKETGNSLVGLTLPVGFQNPLPCTAITLTSGAIRMAKRSV